MRRTARLAVLLAAGAAGCGRLPAALDPAGPQAERIAGLTWWFVGVCAVVYLLVLAALARAAWHRRDPAGAVDRAPVLTPEPAAERRRVWAVAAAAGATVVVLVALLVASLATGDAVAAAAGGARLTVQVTGRQWWWEVRYPGSMAAELVTTANEIHLPVGETVHLEMRSGDVIHSFWVPRLHGKRDLIPGRTTHHFLRVDRAGVFDGQCAEFCGHQHAHMGLRVVAQPRPRFDRWLAAQRLPAAEPDTPLERRGRALLVTSSCALCHSVRGTAAGGRTAPDLTHVASRSTLAAGTLGNGPGHLGGWILDSQGVKPGNRMPPNALGGEDLQALLAYLGSLR